MAKATSGKDVLATFFDEGIFSVLGECAQGAVKVAFGSANGQPVYAICQNGAAMSVKDAEKVVKALEIAAKTGNPVVTFYNSVGSKLEEGLETVKAAAAVNAAVAKHICQLCHIAAIFIKSAGKKVTQIMRKNFCSRNSRQSL